jgi:small subunit ribosomal protein S17
MKTLLGTVVSVKTPQTVQVDVVRQWQHPVYLKSVTRTKRYACHTTDVVLVEGDEVVIEPTRPMSKTKYFRVVKKVEKV